MLAYWTSYLEALPDEPVVRLMRSDLAELVTGYTATRELVDLLLAAIESHYAGNPASTGNTPYERSPHQSGRDADLYRAALVATRRLRDQEPTP